MPRSERIKQPRFPSILFALLVVYATGVLADDADVPMFSVSGFGTLGATHSSESKADFTSTIFKPNGAGYTHDWSPAVDSRVAVQVVANITPQLSAMLQAISEQNYDGSYRPHAEWANIKYQFTPDFSIRIGRTVLPGFLYSETRSVGYAYAWVRPPVDVYNLSPATSTDGMDVSYRMHFNEATHTLRANVGWKDTKLVNNGGLAEARHAWGISDTFEYGALTMRVSLQKSKLTIAAPNALFDAFRQFGPQGVAIADKYNLKRKPYSFYGIGASYDPGDWFAISEWGHLDTNSFIGTRRAWYVSGGYRFGKFTPYLSYAQLKSGNTSDPGLDVSTLPPLAIGPAIGLSTALNDILSTRPTQNTLSIGGRWDFMKNTDLKLQFDHTDIGAGSTGVLINPQPGFQTGGSVDLFSVAVDFVF